MQKQVMTNSSWPEVVGMFGLGHANDRGQQLLKFYATHDLIIANTVFQRANTRRLAELGSDLHFMVIVSRSHREVLRCDVDKVCDRETRRVPGEDWWSC